MVDLTNIQETPLTGEQYYLAMDSETGGLDCRQHSLFTAGYILLDQHFKALKIRTFEFAPHPEKFDGKYSYTEGASRVNHIDPYGKFLTDEETIPFNGKLDPRAFCGALIGDLNYFGAMRGEWDIDVDFTDKNVLPKKIKLIGAATNFDRDFLVEHCGEELKLIFDHRLLDVQNTAADLQRWGIIEPQGLGLQNLCEYFGIDTTLPLYKAHTAGGDVRATYDVFNRLNKIGQDLKNYAGSTGCHLNFPLSGFFPVPTLG